MTDQLQPGDPAPDFTLPSADGTRTSLEDLRGSRVVLYFYPAAGTPGCTAEACDFRDNLGSLRASGYTVLGVSPDPVERLQEFATAEHLTFPLLSDADHAVHERYGAWGEKTIQGRSVVGSLRSTFVLDADGVVEHALYNVQAQGHVADLRERLGIGSGTAPTA